MRALLLNVLFLFSLPAHAKIGEWIGYEAMEDRLGQRLFQSTPACRPNAATIAELKQLDATQATHTNEQAARFLKLSTELAIRPGFLLAGLVGDFQPRATNFSSLLGSRFQPAFEAFLMESSHAVNSLNTFAWELTLRTLAQRLGGLCAAAGRIDPLAISLNDPTLSLDECRRRDVPLRPEAEGLVRKLCGPAGDEAELRATLINLFDLTTGSGSPDEEQTAWLTEVTRAENRALAPADRVELLFKTIFLNPFFVLQH